MIIASNILRFPSNDNMRKVWMALFFFGVALIAINQWRLGQKLNSMELERDAAAQAQPPPSNDSAAKMNELQTKLDEVNFELLGANQKLTNLMVKVSDLERKVGQTQASNQIRPDIVWDPNPQTPPRSWGPEQAIGAPDTPSAGDIPTAWASREPDGGAEWLKLDYLNMVDIAQVRVRESFNPGAVSKVAAVLANGQEYPLWEGTETPGPAPFDAVLDVPANVYAQSVKIYFGYRPCAGLE
jgi:hypothetical protein